MISLVTLIKEQLASLISASQALSSQVQGASSETYSVALDKLTGELSLKFTQHIDEINAILSQAAQPSEEVRQRDNFELKLKRDMQELR